MRPRAVVHTPAREDPVVFPTNNVEPHSHSFYPQAGESGTASDNSILKQNRLLATRGVFGSCSSTQHDIVLVAASSARNRNFPRAYHTCGQPNPTKSTTGCSQKSLTLKWFTNCTSNLKRFAQQDLLRAKHSRLLLYPEISTSDEVSL